VDIRVTVAHGRSSCRLQTNAKIVLPFSRRGWVEGGDRDRAQ
jgi:hypothetical protein